MEISLENLYLDLGAFKRVKDPEYCSSTRDRTHAFCSTIKCSTNWANPTVVKQHIHLAYIWSVYDSTLYPLSACFLSKIVYPLEISFLLFMLLTLKLYAMEWVQKQFNIAVFCWILFYSSWTVLIHCTLAISPSIFWNCFWEGEFFPCSHKITIPHYPSPRLSPQPSALAPVDTLL